MLYEGVQQNKFYELYMIKQAIVRKYRLHITAAVLHDKYIREFHANNNNGQTCIGGREEAYHSFRRRIEDEGMSRATESQLRQLFSAVRVGERGAIAN